MTEDEVMEMVSVLADRWMRADRQAVLDIIEVLPASQKSFIAGALASRLATEPDKSALRDWLRGVLPILGT